MDDFRIELDNPSKNYQPNSKVVGKLVLGAVEVLAFDGLELRFVGGASIRSSPTLDTSFDGSETYFDKTFVVLGESTLQPGEHTFPFAYRLPNRPLPRKYKGVCGEVVYRVEGIMKKSSIFKSNCTVTESFNVISLVDLNEIPEAKEPAEETVTGMTRCCCSCLCCGKTGVTVIAKIPYSGTCPGRLIPFNLLVENKSGSKIMDVKAEVIQKWTMWCSGDKQHFHRSVASVTRNLEIPPKADGVWKYWIRIPADLGQPTQDKLMSEIINVSYTIRFTPVGGRFGLGSPFFCEIPFYVGDIPLVRDNRSQSNVVVGDDDEEDEK